MDTILAKRLRSLRAERELTQRQVASATQIPYHTYTGYERGEQRVPFYRVVALAEFLEVSVDYFAGLTNERKRR